MNHSKREGRSPGIGAAGPVLRRYAVPRWPAAWWVAFLACKPVLVVIRRPDWRGLDEIPRAGGAVLAVNHISELDPLLIAEAVLSTGRTPAFLAKSSLFEGGLVGRWFRAAGHVRVDRQRGGGGFADALDAVRAGALVVVYPEGSISTAPGSGLLPLKTGAVRLAVEAGVPLLPVAQLGAQEILPAYSRRLRIRPLRRPTVSIQVGRPMDLEGARTCRAGSPPVHACTLRLAEVLSEMIDDLRPANTGPGCGQLETVYAFRRLGTWCTRRSRPSVPRE